MNRASMAAASRAGGDPRRPRPLTALLVAAGLVSPLAHAAPEGGVVSGGQASISRSGSQTRIEQRSERAIIDWHGFDVGVAESVQFRQPSASAATLNRIDSGRPSQIDGSLTANGQIFIVNRAGVIFGRGARIDVAGLIATTSNIARQDFLDGRLSFAEPGMPGATVRNEGRIAAADGGFVALVAPQVRNDGTITARLGRVALASGERFTVDLAGDELVRFTLSEQDSRTLEQYGRIDADGGSVILLSAADARHIVAGVVNLGGVVRADTVEQRDGRIILGASGARATIAGRLQARGEGAGSRGGTIDLRADALALGDATLDVSGEAGGGAIRIGGAWQGSGDGARARQVSVAPGSELRADAIDRGDGGEVVVWADGQTAFQGRISARGGSRGGDGGRVEVSGKEALAFGGDVDAGAAAGRAGMLLLDPLDLAIGAREAGNVSRILRSGTSLRLQADRDISVDSAIDGRGGVAGAGLTLDAGRDISIHDFILTNDGAIALLARGGSIGFAAGRALFAGSAPIDLTAGGQLAAGVLLTSNSVTLRSTGGAVHLDGVVDPANGELIVEAAGDVEINAPALNLNSGADVRIAAGGNVRINEQINGLEAAVPGGEVEVTAGGDVAVNDFVVTRDGGVGIRAGGGVAFGEGAAVFAGDAPIDIESVATLAAGATITRGAVSLRSTAADVRITAPVEPDNGDLTVVAATDISVEAPVVNLLAGSDVSMQAGRDIAVLAEINGTGAAVAGGRVSLEAGGALRIEDHVATASGAIDLRAGGAVEQAPDAIVSAGAAPLTMTSGSRLVTGILLGSDRLTLNGAGGVDIAGVVPDDAGDLIVTSAGDVHFLAPISNLRAGSELRVDAGGDIVVSAQIDGLGATRAGSVSLVADGNILLERFIATSSAPVALDAGGGLTIDAGGGVYSETAPIALLAAGAIVQNGVVQSPAPISIVSSAGDVSLRAGLAPGGAVTVDAAGTLRIEAPLTSLAGGSTLTLLAGGDILVDAQVDGRGGVAGGGLVIDAGGDLIASRPIVTNGGVITIDAEGQASFASAAALLSGGAPITVSAGERLTSGPVSTSGRISLVSRGSTLAVSGAVAGGDVVLQAPAGLSILRPVVASASLTATTSGRLGVAAPIQGGSVALDGGSVVIGDRVLAGSRLSVSGSSVSFSGGGLFSNGSLSVSSSGSLTTGPMSVRTALTLASGGNLSVTQGVGGLSGSVSYRAGGNLTLDAPIAGLGGGARLSAGGDVTVNARIDGVGGAVNVASGGDTRLNDHIVTNDASITIDAGGTIQHAPDGVDAIGAPQSVQLRAGTASISETTGGSVDTGSMITTGAVSVTSTGGDINVEVPIYETTGTTTLTAAGDINVNQVIANATSGSDLIMDAGGNINIHAKVGPWDRIDATYPVAGRNALPGGNITMTAVGDINVGAEIATFRDTLAGDVARLSLTSTAGSVDFTAPDLRVMSDSGAVSISAFDDFANGPALADVNATPTAGYYTSGQLSLASTGGDVSIDSLIPNSTGSVLISAADQVRVNQRIYTDNGDITILAGVGGIVQNPTADPNPDVFLNTGFISDIDSGTGNLTLEAAGDILPTYLRTAATLTVKSTAGAIIGGSTWLARHVDPATLVLTELSFPNQVNLAGFAGITDFQVNGAANLAAISAGSSITGLGYNEPSTLLLIAAQDIANVSSAVGPNARLFAGRDITTSRVYSLGAVELRAGRHLTLSSAGLPLRATSAQLSTGSDPFAGLGATTVAGVSVPAWGGPFGVGNIAIGGAGDLVWIAGEGGLVVDATGSITLPRVHVAFGVTSPADAADPRHLLQPLTLTAGTGISVEQVETTGPVSMVTTTGDITLGATLGAHVTVEDPAIVPVWNPTDRGVATLVLQADGGNINLYEARAEGDITILAPLGQVVFLDPGHTGIESVSGNRNVSDSDGVAFTDTIDPTPVARLSEPGIVSPAVAPGPTNVGPGAPAVPGAVPPFGPSAISVTMSGAGGVSAAVAAPGATSVGSAAPGGVDGGGASAPAGGAIDATLAPDAGDGFGEIFVAEADQSPVEVRDPVRVEARREKEEDEARQDAVAAGAVPSGDGEQQNADGSDGDEVGPDAKDDGGRAALAATDGDAAEEEEDEAASRPGDEEQSSVVVFAGGRGDARERDFGRGLPFEDGRVRP
ncbi:MAG: filamentous hemagglutinin N-terminal domain-containing protein [Rhodocyclaceae bacterium]|nr:filamentous hemagglutinin N-terminal domain-containing protein [Rhodocyclaceae bacterium]